MFTAHLILRNLVRQPVTSALTLAGVSLGIGTIVALGAVTRGVERSAVLTISAGNADFIVAQRTSGGLMFSSLTEEDRDRIAGIDGVRDAVGVTVFITRVGSDPFFRLIGIEAADLADAAFPVVDGGPYPEGARSPAYLGDRAARQFGASAGAPVAIAGRTFTASGVFRTGNRWLDAGAFAPLDEVQALAAKPGLLTMVYVRVAGAEPGVVAASIREEFPHLTTISNLSEYQEVDQGLRVLGATNQAVTALALIAAAVGVTNTMARSVFERTREIGILRAIGWRRRRVLAMILGETLVLSTVGAVVGSAGGALFTEVLEALSESVRSFVAPSYGFGLFARGAIVALVVALAGALYPAYRAAQLEPLDALRSE